MLRALEVANYLLTLFNEEVGDLVSNLKIQKLLYYSQGFNLAMYNTPLFVEPIQAWPHGPVVPDVYHEFKKYENGPIPYPQNVDFGKFDRQTKELLNEVHSVYGQFDAWKLQNMTHQESPWLEASTTLGGVISHDSMKAYFKTQLIND